MPGQLKRRQARVNAFIAMFELSFGQNIDEIIDFSRQEGAEYAIDDFGEGLVRYYSENAEKIDTLIEENLKGWKVTRLQKVSLAILRLALCEMLREKEDMNSVFINEAVEISKIYGDEGDYQFVNGVLGSIAKGLHSKSADNSNSNEPQ